jgi:hypothetical protein
VIDKGKRRLNWNITKCAHYYFVEIHCTSSHGCMLVWLERRPSTFEEEFSYSGSKMSCTFRMWVSTPSCPRWWLHLSATMTPYTSRQFMVWRKILLQISSSNSWWT